MQHSVPFIQPMCQCAINITYSLYVCVFVTLGIQHATRTRHIAICSWPCYTTFFHIIS